jgi:hypothetical protein
VSGGSYSGGRRTAYCMLTHRRSGGVCPLTFLSRQTVDTVSSFDSIISKGEQHSGPFNSLNAEVNSLNAEVVGRCPPPPVQNAGLVIGRHNSRLSYPENIHCRILTENLTNSERNVLKLIHTDG